MTTVLSFPRLVSFHLMGFVVKVTLSGEVCLRVLSLPHQYNSINAPPIFISNTTITRKNINSMYHIHKYTTNLVH
jgi:hypothetical protein